MLSEIDHLKGKNFLLFGSRGCPKFLKPPKALRVRCEVGTKAPPRNEVSYKGKQSHLEFTAGQASHPPPTNDQYAWFLSAKAPPSNRAKRLQQQRGEEEHSVREMRRPVRSRGRRFQSKSHLFFLKSSACLFGSYQLQKALMAGWGGAASLQSAIAQYERGFHEGGAEKVRRRFEMEFIREEEKHRSEQLF